jgi:hypothetical protein
MTTSVRRRRLIIPMTAFIGCGAITAGSAIGGAPAGAVAGMAAITVIATLGYLFVGFGKTDFGALAAGSPDERQVTIGLRAGFFAGVVMTMVLLVGTMVELALGHNGQPWISLAAGEGVAYLAAFVVLRHR